LLLVWMWRSLTLPQEYVCMWSRLAAHPDTLLLACTRRP
jgi:hypothetical protein